MSSKTRRRDKAIEKSIETFGKSTRAWASAPQKTKQNKNTRKKRSK